MSIDKAAYLHALYPLKKRGTPMQGLIEGRCCHYVAYNGRHLAALVIGFDKETADLAVFTNMANVNGEKNFGLQFHQNIHYSETKEPGTFHWIEQA